MFRWFGRIALIFIVGTVSFVGALGLQYSTVTHVVNTMKLPDPPDLLMIVIIPIIAMLAGLVAVCSIWFNRPFPGIKIMKNLLPR